jgi:hypothetical protein
MYIEGDWISRQLLPINEIIVKYTWSVRTKSVRTSDGDCFHCFIWEDALSLLLSHNLAAGYFSWPWHYHFSPLPLLFKSPLPGQEGCIFFSPRQQTNIPTWISMTYFDAYASIMFIHVQICLLSDFITSDNIQLLFRSHNAVFTKRTASAF